MGFAIWSSNVTEWKAKKMQKTLQSASTKRTKFNSLCHEFLIAAGTDNKNGSIFENSINVSISSLIF